MLSEIEGDVAASNSAYSYSSLSRGYGILYFTTGGSFMDVLYYKKSSSAAMTAYPPVVYCPQLSPTTVPEGVLVGGSVSGVGVYYGLGSFVASSGVSSCDKITRYGSLCVICSSSYYLDGQHNCYSSSSCPAGSYYSGSNCAMCNRKCSTCTASAPTICATCSDAGKSGWNCACSTATYVNSAGTCGTKCPLGTRAVKDTYCVGSCPGHEATVADWASATMGRTAYEAQATPATVLEFSNTYKGVKIAAPSNITAENFPRAFTITFWVYTKGWKVGETQYLVNAFNFVKIWKSDTSLSGGTYNYTGASVGTTTLSTPSSDAIKTMLALQEGKWTFVGLTKRAVNQSDGTSYMEIHLMTPLRNVSESVPDVSDTESTAEASEILTSSSYDDERPTSFKSYIILGGCVNTTTDQLIDNTSFSGYLREFKIVGRYMGPQNLLSQKYHSHSPYWHDILYYAPLNDTVSSGFATLTDYSVYSASQSIASVSTSYPRFTAYPNPSDIQSLPLYRWDDLYTCWNPLKSGRKLPPIVGSAYIYSSMFETSSTNYILDSSGNTRFATGDVVKLVNSSCGANSSFLVASRSATYSNSMATWTTVDSAMPFYNVPAGTHYSLCYKSSQYDTMHLLGRVYVARPPDSIVPPQKLLYSQFESTVLLRSFGGDESYGSRIYLAKSLTDLDATTNTSTSKMLMRLEDTYELANFVGFVQGTYYLYWTPNYSKDYAMYIKLANVHVKKVDNSRVYFGTNLFSSL